MGRRSQERGQSYGEKPLEGLGQVGDGLIHGSDTPLGDCVENGGHVVQLALAPSLECSMALSANGTASPMKPVRAAGSRDWAPQAVESCGQSSHCVLKASSHDEQCPPWLARYRNPWTADVLCEG